MKYIEFINSIPIANEIISATLTTGDVEYPGTALEISIDDKEVFEFVVNEKGEHQVIIYSNNTVYRLFLHVLEDIITSAKKNVRYIDPPRETN